MPPESGSVIMMKLDFSTELIHASTDCNGACKTSLAAQNPTEAWLHSWKLQDKGLGKSKIED